jgi:hypothetical protein
VREKFGKIQMTIVRGAAHKGRECKVSTGVNRGGGVAMKLYWKERRVGQRLVLSPDGQTEIEVGAVRKTPRGFDALAKTNTYDPGRAQKGFATLEEAKLFVESFHPWDLFGGDPDMKVETEVQPLPSEASATAADEPAEAAEPSETSSPTGDGPTQPGVEEKQPRKGGWRFWKRG